MVPIKSEQHLHLFDKVPHTDLFCTMITPYEFLVFKDQKTQKERAIMNNGVHSKTILIKNFKSIIKILFVILSATRQQKLTIVKTLYKK